MNKKALIPFGISVAMAVVCFLWLPMGGLVGALVLLFGLSTLRAKTGGGA